MESHFDKPVRLDRIFINLEGYDDKYGKKTSYEVLIIVDEKYFIQEKGLHRSSKILKEFLSRIVPGTMIMVMLGVDVDSGEQIIQRIKNLTTFEIYDRNFGRCFITTD